MVQEQERKQSKELFHSSKGFFGVKGECINKYREFMKRHKRTIVLVGVGLLCVVIIGCAIYKNISYNEERQSENSTELLKDSLFLRQVEMQELLLRKSSVLDSINLDNKSSNSIIKEEIQKIRDNSDKIQKFQKKIYQNSKK